MTSSLESAAVGGLTLVSSFATRRHRGRNQSHNHEAPLGGAVVFRPFITRLRKGRDRLADRYDATSLAGNQTNASTSSCQERLAMATPMLHRYSYIHAFRSKCWRPAATHDLLNRPFAPSSLPANIQFVLPACLPACLLRCRWFRRRWFWRRWNPRWTAPAEVTSL